MSQSSSSLIQSVSDIPLLTVSEERRLSERVMSGDKSAVDSLVLSNVRLVYKIAHEFRGNSRFGLEDIVSAGICGLRRAAEKYDWRKGAKFSSYARWWVRQAINRQLLSMSFAVHVPMVAYRKGTRIYEQSLDKPIDSGMSDSPTLEDRLDASGQDMFAEFVNNDMVSRLHELLGQMDLDKREREILSRRFLKEKPDTLQALATRLHLSRERIRQIESDLLRRLRSEFDKDPVDNRCSMPFSN